MKRLGKIRYEVICPICDTGYLASGNELVPWIFDENTNEWVHTRNDEATKAGFYCEYCNRNVWIDSKSVKPVRCPN